jgi:hypothetical protein
MKARWSCPDRVPQVAFFAISLSETTERVVLERHLSSKIENFVTAVTAAKQTLTEILGGRGGPGSARPWESDMNREEMFRELTAAELDEVVGASSINAVMKAFGDALSAAARGGGTAAPASTYWQGTDEAGGEQA